MSRPSELTLTVQFHAAGQAAAGEGELSYVNCWPALTPTAAESLTEW